MDSAKWEDVVSARESLSRKEINSSPGCSDNPIIGSLLLEDAGGPTRFMDQNISDSESTDSDFSKEAEVSQTFLSCDSKEENEVSTPIEVQPKFHSTEDFSSWQRIIRLDAICANGDWIPYSPTLAEVSEERALRLAEAVGLKDYENLEPCRIFHSSWLVAILEAYALYDPEIGYCQGMSNLLSHIIAVIMEDHEAFWCFAGFMKKARHNFRLDDTDQAAIRARISKSAWNEIRQRAPPTEDLFFYAIEASVLQRRKQILEKYSSMDEIVRECNNMDGQLDVWKLLDDARDLVVSVHDKIETTS
nr:hypothetical protein [Tanacetum cinerariifolium]